MTGNRAMPGGTPVAPLARDNHHGPEEWAVMIALTPLKCGVVPPSAGVVGI